MSGGDNDRARLEFESNNEGGKEGGEECASSTRIDLKIFRADACKRTFGTFATDLGEPLLRVEYLDEQRHLIVHYLEPVSWLRQQLLYRLRGGERSRGARCRRRGSGSGAATRSGSRRAAAVVQMGAPEEDRVPVRGDAAVERAERQAVKRWARPGRGSAEKRLSGG